MPHYKIYRSYGYAGTQDVEIIEADSLSDAEEQAHMFALENVESWAEELGDEDK